MDTDRFSKKRLSIFVAFILVGLVSMGSTAAGANTILTLNGGQMDTNGNNIVDGGTTIWDASNGYIPKSNIQSLTASDVGLGNVQNEAQVSENGDTIKGNTTINASINMQEDRKIVWNQNSGAYNSGDTATIKMRSFGSSLITDSNNGIDLANVDEISGGSDSYVDTGSSGPGLPIKAKGNIVLESEKRESNGAQIQMYDGSATAGIFLDGDVSTSNDCEINDDTLNCDGSKNWVHDLNSSYEAVYSSQESPQVRAVFEGKAHVVDSKEIQLPDHFSKTVSDSEPMLRAQVTPQGTLTDVAVMEKTDDYLKIAVEKETDVNFRITGIREGYEDKQVVRPKGE